MKKLFVYLAILNLLDGVVTYIGLELRVIAEANPFMDNLYGTSPSVFLGVKLLLSVALLLFCITNKLPRSHMVKALVVTASVFYLLICMMHGFWLFEIS
ncbi:DUF5658 family protein [Sediminibacillus albus]|uniref:DUF5658 domain-containing protein n=1 Tax=Sediminibacillus albus TaxID=407036 RepID=A0A1G9B7P5_9BACI|nr:DUF5658 family protein [Sediminibacillus albus]SDK35519.1 hypothetical protein SAMN05216243_2859 [Sediminibacillus albus]